MNRVAGVFLGDGDRACFPDDENEGSVCAVSFTQLQKIILFCTYKNKLSKSHVESECWTQGCHTGLGLDPGGFQCCFLQISPRAASFAPRQISPFGTWQLAGVNLQVISRTALGDLANFLSFEKLLNLALSK